MRPQKFVLRITAFPKNHEASEFAEQLLNNSELRKRRKFYVKFHIKSLKNVTYVKYKNYFEYFLNPFLNFYIIIKYYIII